MKLTLAEPKYLKDSVATISELVTEARFHVTKEGLTLVAMDPANVAMVVFKLFSSSFVEYELKEDVNIALNLSHLKNVLRRVGSADLVTLSMKDNKLLTTISGSSTRKFSLPLLDLDEREQRIPNLEFTMNIQMPTEELAAAVDDMSVVSDSLSLECTSKMLIVRASGDLTDADVEIPASDKVKITVDNDDQLISRYSIEYLKKMVTASKLSSVVSVQFKKNYPLRLEFVEKDRVQLAFVLAPRFENN